MFSICSAASSSDYGSSTGPLHLSGPTPPCVPPRPWAHGIDSFYSRSLDTSALQTGNLGNCLDCAFDFAIEMTMGQ